MLARLRYLEEQTYPLVFSQELTPSEPALVSWTIDIFLRHKRGFPNSSVGKESACNVGNPGIPGLGRSPGEGNGNHSSILAWTIPWTEDLVGYSPWGRKESDTTVWLTFLSFPFRHKDEPRSHLTSWYHKRWGHLDWPKCVLFLSPKVDVVLSISIIAFYINIST